MRPSTASPLLLLLLSSLACAQVELRDLVKVARERAERTRPALDPFVANLSIDYEANKAAMDATIASVVALGDRVVPELLERLQPQQDHEGARHLAGNCRRALEFFDPASYFGALVELANGQHDSGRAEAIRLLGQAGTPQATPLLIDLLDHAKADTRNLALAALTRRKAAPPAAKVAVLLASTDRTLRRNILACLTAAAADGMLDAVRAAFGTETENKLLPAYVEYFAAAARENDTVARALVPLLSRERIEWRDCKRLIEVLATVAPREHEPTIRNLLNIISSGELNQLGLQAALTMQALGDRQGIIRLRRALDEQLRKPSRRNEAALYELRGQLGIATEEFSEAFVDFEKALSLAGDSAGMARQANIGMMRCEARRKRIQNLTKLMKTSGLSVAEIEAIGADDPVFRETLQQDKVRVFLQTLGKDPAK